MLDDPVALILAAAAAFLVGLTKTGIPGLGNAVALLMVMAIPGKYSVGLLCTLLLIGDVFALRYYRLDGKVWLILKLLPSMAVGVAVGAYVLAALDEELFRPALGILVGALVFVELLRRRGDSTTFAGHPMLASAVGFCAGFATTVGNAAGPIMSIYLLMMGLKKREFLGTITWYYFTFNALKIPVFMYIGVLPVEHFRYTVWLAPAVAIGAITGAIIFNYIPQRLFDILVLVLTAVGAAWLLASSLT